ncbi:hypothetical protein Cgig2_016101 [Carnegiea gigantea]|uniref:Ycf20-like protein n=1 Tax=Carnegiea gigantea TaxID=171969 RepID=A0A9Q1QMB6_9CARY|nr:hypothetical protein Cgig2_016101 [Carnegiea gigantea]
MILSTSPISQAMLSIFHKEISLRVCCFSSTFPIQDYKILTGQAFTMLAPKSQSFLRRRVEQNNWKLAFALDTGGIPSSSGPEDDLNEDTSGLGQTRLSRIVIAGGRQLLGKLDSARKNFPMKVFLLLLGFYTANALATILGQTGDWDVLVAGIVVAVIEGIGMLMYKKPPSLPSGRLQSWVAMINYWKAGICLGLFVDAFKLGS